MKVLYPRIQPTKNETGECFFSAFETLTKESDRMILTSGYISEESILFLRRCLNDEFFPNFQLVVGMLGLEGFTRAQYRELRELNALLIKNNKGKVYVSMKYKYHGKSYTFLKNDIPIASIVGSTNISILGDRDKRQFEVDILLDDPTSITKVMEIQLDLIAFSEPVDDNLSVKLIESSSNNYLEQFSKDPEYLCQKVSASELSNIIQNSDPARSYKLELKTTPKSNLNVFNGKPRGGGTSGLGKYIKRPWFETEIIVSKKVTSLPFYPQKMSFYVCTDDGWFFKCGTQGDYSKNFRSEKSLCILGAWIKGRLIDADCVNFGEIIKDEALRKYGRRFVTLTWTNVTADDNSHIYFLDFKA